MAKRTIAQQLKDLQARQALDTARTTARALLDDAKTALHKRDFATYRAVCQQLSDLGAVLDSKPAQAKPAQQQLPSNEGAA